MLHHHDQHNQNHSQYEKPRQLEQPPPPSIQQQHQQPKPRNDQYKRVQNYILNLNRVLGRGSYGCVFEGVDLNKDNRRVAVKQISQCPIGAESDQLISVLKNEINNMKLLNKHENIVRLLDVLRSSNYIYLIFDFCNGGSLETYLNNRVQPLPATEALEIISQIVSGFACLYKSRVVHRDLKLANILLHDGVVKIADFGSSKHIQHSRANPCMVSQVGSPIYMSPQLFNEEGYSSKLDIWSLGVIFYELLYKTTPWKGKSQYHLKANINDLPLEFPEHPYVNEDIKHLITLMLDKNESSRVSWTQLFKLFLEKGKPKRIRLN